MRHCQTILVSTVIIPVDGENRRWIPTVAPYTEEIPLILLEVEAVKPMTMAENWSPAMEKPSSNQPGEASRPEETIPAKRAMRMIPTMIWKTPVAARRNPMPSLVTIWRNPMQKTKEEMNRYCHPHHHPLLLVGLMVCASSRPEMKPRYLLPNAYTRYWRPDRRQEWKAVFSNPMCATWFRGQPGSQRPSPRAPKASCPRPCFQEAMSTVPLAKNERPTLRMTTKTNWTGTLNSNKYCCMALTEDTRAQDFLQ
mmetsp:Transcript_17708/g.38684  ORF Transcript_17708/g.38684 Transcript_17708/m.38684 type:complete len:253 (-) Transcript_17708:91-849(-)